MATQLQSRRGTTAQMNAFTGAEGEIAVNTSTDTLHVHDGSTAGGHALAKADGSNIATYAGSFTTLAASGATTLSSTLAVTGEITANGGIALGDSDKATFGASDDLQIYHDGVHSRIVDAGTGNLSLQGNDLRIKNSDASATYIQAANGGAVTLHHNDAVTLATTSTGIDVTGTVTADGLTVDGNARIEEIGAIAKLTLERGGTANSADSAAVDMLETNSGTEGANFGDAGTNGFRLKLDGSANDFLIQSGAATTITTRFGIDRDSGDISFYNAAGNSQSLFWDSSAESLGIGTSSPSQKLHVYEGSTSSQAYVTVQNNRSRNAAVLTQTTNGGFYTGTSIGTDTLCWQVYDASAGERMRLDAAGRVTMPYQPAFSVRPSSDQSNISRPANTTVIWGTEIFDQGGNFSSNTFTAPVTGRYQLNVNIYAQTIDSAADYVQFALVTSNRSYYYIFSTNTLSQDAAYMSFPIAVLADMDASDTAIVQAQLNNTGSAQMDITTISYFSGYLVA